MRRAAHVGSRCALAIGLSLLAACSLFSASDEPDDVDLAFEGLPGIERAEAVRRIAYLFQDFARVERPEPVLFDASFELELLLAEQGWRLPRVDVALETGPSGRPLARFVLVPGTRTRLGAVDLVGVAASDRAEALAVLRAAGLESWYSERGVEAGGSALVAWYRERGHAEVRLSEPRVTFAADGAEAVVALEVEPGPAYVLARIVVEDVVEVPAQPETQAEQASATPRALVDAAVADLLASPYTDRLARTVRGRILGVYAEEGYPDAVVGVPSLEADGGNVLLRYRVVPGPRVRVGRVRFEGHGSTSESFLERRVVLESGDWYRRSLLARSLGNLSRAGIFDSIAVELVDVPADDDVPGVDTRDVVVEVEEAAAREFHIEPGYGSYERLRLGFGARQRNLFGTGRILDFTASVAELAQRADLSLVDPWILGADATANATLFWNRRQEPSFLRLERGVELGATWRYSDAWGLRTRWQYRRSDTSDEDVLQSDLVEDIVVSEVSVQPAWDTRDRFDDPHRGQLSRGVLDVSLDALGSEVEYVRLRLEHARFLPIGPRTTLGLAARVGWIASLGGTDSIPIQERFFNGGENSVRSYRESQLGPRDANGTPIGGEASTTASIELRQALGRRFQLAAFADAGTVELRHEDVFAFQEPGYAVGVGLRYLLPIGPIRLDGALNPDPKPFEADAVLHLSVGFSF